MSNSEIAEVAEPETLESDVADKATSALGRRTEGSSVRSALLLVVTFLFAFCAAGSLLIVVGHFGYNTPRSLGFSDRSAEVVSEESIANPLIVNSGGVFSKAVADPSLNPSSGQEYLIFAWFRLRKGIRPGDFAALLGKFEAQTKQRPGFAVSLEGAPDGIRPRVYWSDAQSRGRWYSFASRQLRRREWYLVAVSFSRDTFLSAYVVPARADDQPDDIFLGGHRIEPAVIATSGADLVIGAYGASQFRGDIGPFGVLRGSELRGKVAEILKAMRMSPNQIPPLISPSTVQLWASPQIDQGPRKVTLVSVRQDQGKNRKQEKAPSASSHRRPPMGQKTPSKKRVIR